MGFFNTKAGERIGKKTVPAGYCCPDCGNLDLWIDATANVLVTSTRVDGKLVWDGRSQNDEPFAFPDDGEAWCAECGQSFKTGDCRRAAGGNDDRHERNNETA